jgi:hypothetical protein
MNVSAQTVVTSFAPSLPYAGNGGPQARAICMNENNVLVGFYQLNNYIYSNAQFTPTGTPASSFINNVKSYSNQQGTNITQYALNDIDRTPDGEIVLGGNFSHIQVGNNKILTGPLTVLNNTGSTVVGDFHGFFTPPNTQSGYLANLIPSYIKDVVVNGNIIYACGNIYLNHPSLPASINNTKAERVIRIDMVAGTITSSLVVFNTASVGQQFSSGLNTMELDGSGGLLVGGSFTCNGYSSLIRLDENTLAHAPTFSPLNFIGVNNPTVYDLLRDPVSNDIVIGGAFYLSGTTSVSNTTVNNISLAKINTSIVGANVFCENFVGNSNAISCMAFHCCGIVAGVHGNNGSYALLQKYNLTTGGTENFSMTFNFPYIQNDVGIYQIITDGNNDLYVSGKFRINDNQCYLVKITGGCSEPPFNRFGYCKEWQGNTDLFNIKIDSPTNNGGYIESYTITPNATVGGTPSLPVFQDLNMNTTYVITRTLTNECGTFSNCFSETIIPPSINCPSTQRTKGQTSTSETNIKPEDKISLFPNPSSGKFEITSKYPMTSIKIVDLSGRTVLVNNNIYSTNYFFNIEGLSNGIYTINVTGSDWKELKKIVIQN